MPLLENGRAVWGLLTGPLPLLNMLQALGREERVNRANGDEDRMLPLFLERERPAQSFCLHCAKMLRPENSVFSWKVTEHHRPVVLWEVLTHGSLCMLVPGIAFLGCGEEKYHPLQAQGTCPRGAFLHPGFKSLPCSRSGSSWSSPQPLLLLTGRRDHTRTP